MSTQFNGEMTVTSHNIRLVRDVNEISYHWAECMFSFERANGKVGGSGIKPGATNGIGFGAGALGPGASQGMALEAGGAGNAVSDAVVEYIKTFGEESEQGASLQVSKGRGGPNTLTPNGTEIRIQCEPR